MEFIINRIEGEFAVCEGKNGEIFNIPRTVITDGKEGDIIKLLIDKEETLKKKGNTQKRLNKLFNEIKGEK